MNRVVPGILMAIFCLLLLVFGSTLFVHLALLLVGGMALRELLRMTCPQLKGVFFFLTLVVTLFPLIGAFQGNVDGVMAGVLCSFIGVSIISFRLVEEFETIFAYFASACFATLYISTFLAYLSLLSRFENGNYWLIILLAITAGADTGAYYFGKNFGKRKLLPAVSPKKTIVGGVSGLFVGILSAVCVSFFLPIPTSLFFLVPSAALLVITGMIGDLAESIIKRSSHIKDSGTLLGGHGGILDRIDSLLPAGPVLFYLLSWGILQ